MTRLDAIRTILEPPIPFDPRGFGTLHLPGTGGARTVETADLLKTRIALETTAPLHGCVALIGEPGLGKTLACGTALAQLGLIPCYASIPPAPKDKEFEETLLNAVTNAQYDLRNTRATERRDLARVCREHEFVFALDDIERAAGYGIELVRYMWDQNGDRATFVIIGSKLDPFLAANPALESRINRFVRFHPWTVTEACGSREDRSGYVRQYHPLFGDAPFAVLEYAHDVFAHGYFRRWARLLEALLTLGVQPDQARLTRDLVDEAIALVNQE